MNSVSNIANTAFYTVSISAVEVAVLSAYSRVTAGTLALLAKGASKVTDFIGQKSLSDNLNYIGEKCSYFVTRDLQPELCLTAFRVASIGLLHIAGYVLNAANLALPTAAQNIALSIAAPIAVIGALSIGSRVTAGALAVGAKATSMAADYIGQDVLSKRLNDAGDRLISFATKSIEPEMDVAIKLTAFAAAIIANGVLYRGVSKLLFSHPESLVVHGPSWFI